MTETELIEGLSRQDSKAQQQTIDRYGGEVFALVVRVVAVAENAEEVYQDVFVKVFRNIGQYASCAASACPSFTLRTMVMKPTSCRMLRWTRRWET